MNASDLIAFEAEVEEAFKEKKIKGPIHLSGGNEEQLIEIFQTISREDYICTSYRNHYHALLHGIPREKVMAEILVGRSMNLSFPEYRFMSSAIVGGMLPIAVGLAAGLKMKGEARKVWCFVGDMAAMSGAFREATNYARGHDIPIQFVVEDNEMSCDSPTDECWGMDFNDYWYDNIQHYTYKRKYPHAGIGRDVF